MRYELIWIAVLLGGCAQVSGLTDRFSRGGTASEEAAAGAGPLVAPMEIEAGEAEADGSGAEGTEAGGAGDSQTPVAVSGQSGQTIAALGDPARPGAWMETPLVSKERAGQVHYKGKGVNVTLIPAGGPATGGSRLSLEAMQALGLPLTDLTEVKVEF